MVIQFNAIKAKPLTLTLSQRERGLTELYGRCAPTCDFSGELGLAKRGYALLFRGGLAELSG
jgi:hypothetical protein